MNIQKIGKQAVQRELRQDRSPLSTFVSDIRKADLPALKTFLETETAYNKKVSLLIVPH
jgi:hypothetical protein